MTTLLKIAAITVICGFLTIAAGSIAITHPNIIMIGFCIMLVGLVLVSIDWALN